MLLAATSIGAAEEFAQGQDLHVVLTLTRAEVMMNPVRLRRLVRESGAHGAVIHTVDWRRQGSPQLYELAAAVMPVSSVVIADDSTRRDRPVPRGERLAAPLRLAGDVAVGSAGLAREHAHLVRTRRIARPARVAALFKPCSVLAIWFGGLGSQVGGSVTHMAGVLRGFREAGLEVAVLTAGEPPPQIAAVANSVASIPGVRRGERITSEMERITSNRLVRRAAARVIGEARPGFVYQRHRAFLTAGLDASRLAGAPLVLEWNASEVWAYDNWEHASLKGAFRAALEQREELVVRGAALTVAVSRRAVEMALAAGAEPSRVVCVPNGVDVAEVDQINLRRAPGVERGGATVGWIGTFGPWHGAEILIRALASLAPDVRLLMIGDGALRVACQELARDLSVDQRIEWTGVIPHDEAVARLLGCDLLASPHVPLAGQPFFGSPTKLFEYMATGRPIVASRLEQIGEVLDHGRTAWLVEPGSPDALTRGIAEVLGRPDRGAALGAAARIEAVKLHTWRSRADTILAALYAPEALATRERSPDE